MPSALVVLFYFHYLQSICNDWLAACPAVAGEATMADRSSGPEKKHEAGVSGAGPQERDLELAGAIHDVNQMLAVITGRAGLLLRRGPGSDWEKNLRAVELAARDAGAILARLDSGEAVPGSDREFETRLRDAVAEAGLLIGPPTGEPWSEDEGATWILENEVPEDLLAAMPGQIVREVLSNLLLNSLEASSQGVAVKVSSTIQNRCAVLVYRDNGPGLPKAIMESMFQPGRSTSGDAGRGIGLAGCQALLRRWTGDLRLADEQGSGAAFEVHLPLTDTVYAPDESTAPPHVQPARSVLIVDDEMSVRDMLADVMAELGCHVAQAKDSGEALALFGPGAFDMVFLDQSLPGMLGDELAGVLREKDPAVAIVLATGWGREKALDGVNPDHVDLTAIKPLAMQKMVELLSEGSALADRRRKLFGPEGHGNTISEREKEC
jgi:CheY-like chemotaxis protein